MAADHPVFEPRPRRRWKVAAELEPGDSFVTKGPSVRYPYVSWYVERLEDFGGAVGVVVWAYPIEDPDGTWPTGVERGTQPLPIGDVYRVLTPSTSPTLEVN